MAEMDTYTKLYMRKSAVFADFMNLALFHGERVIQPQQLHEMDPTMDVILGHGKGETLSLVRDILKEFIGYTDGERVFAYLGIENQTDVHYAAPVWVGLYDHIQLYKQVEVLTDRLRELGQVRDKILRGFKGMMLHPVCTAILYWGTKPWDGPQTMHEMFGPIPDALKPLIPDRRVIIIEPCSLEQSLVDGMETDLRLVFECMRHKKDKDLDAFIKGTPRFHCIDKLAGQLIRKTTGAALQLDEDDMEGQFDMSDMWEELTQKWMEDGKKASEQELNLLKRENGDLRAKLEEIRQQLRGEGWSNERLGALFGDVKLAT